MKILSLDGSIGTVIAGNKTFSGNVAIQGTLDVTGVATFTTTVTGSGNIMAGAAFALGFTGRSQFKSSADGIINVCAAAGTTGSSLAMASGKVISFSSTTDPAGTVDTSIGRSAAGVVGLYSGTAQALGSSLALASDKSVFWSSTTDPDGSILVALKYRANDGGVGGATPSGMMVFGGSDTNGAAAFGAAFPIIARTSSLGLTQNYTRTIHTNEGAGGEITFTLYTATTGYENSFYVHTAQSLKIQAAAGDTIRCAAGVSAPAGYIRCATAGAVIRLVAVNATEYVAVYQTGVWTVDV